jgi:DNA-directed RNA polymerase subunit RPC12/RpoP
MSVLKSRKCTFCGQWFWSARYLRCPQCRRFPEPEQNDEEAP